MISGDFAEFAKRWEERSDLSLSLIPLSFVLTFMTLPPFDQLFGSPNLTLALGRVHSRIFFLKDDKTVNNDFSGN